MIQGRAELREAYRDPHESRDYINARFREPLGALLHSRQARYLRRALTTHQPRRVLEIAPGPARLTVAVATPGCTIVAVDASRPMLHEARQRLFRAGVGRCQLLQGDAFELPFTQSFDLAYTFRLIRHFEASDRVRLYRQIRAVLKPGGLLIFDAVNATVAGPLRAAAPPGVCGHYDALLRPEQISEELADAGFELVDLAGVQRRYTVLHGLQCLAAPRSRVIARAAMEVVDRLGGEPAEWIVTARRRKDAHE